MKGLFRVCSTFEKQQPSQRIHRPAADGGGPMNSLGKKKTRKERGKSSKAECLGWNSRQDGGRLVERSEPFPPGLFAKGGVMPEDITREPEVFPPCRFSVVLPALTYNPPGEGIYSINRNNS